MKNERAAKKPTSEYTAYAAKPSPDYANWKLQRAKDPYSFWLDRNMDELLAIVAWAEARELSVDAPR